MKCYKPKWQMRAIQVRKEVDRRVVLLNFEPVIREAARARMLPGRVEVGVFLFLQCHLRDLYRLGHIQSHIYLMNGVTGVVQRGVLGPQNAPATGHMADWLYENNCT